MALFDTPVREVQHHARRAANQASPAIQQLARLGYAAKGVVYLIIGGVAAQAAFSRAEQVQGSEGALKTVLQQPFGKVLLGIMALGLAGFVVWRMVQAATDPEHKEGGAKRAFARIGYAMSGVLYAGLTLEAVRMLRGSGGGQGGGTAHWTAMVMDKPFGRVAVGLAGLGIVAYGIYQLIKAFKGDDLDKRLNLEGSAVATRRRVVAVARAGTAARGVVFCIIGWLVIKAAMQYDPAEAQGLQGALVTLRDAAYGRYLLGLVALGLIAYGITQLVKARYRVIRAT
ncbi:DUF1206 domain-containing protein [Longimicrobium sp.]|uniref:DUF1206 domain-containing protein n=1 Tax=Longimicrobium sp. TaxID=2029185 RepID=UPI003B3BC85D